MQHKSVEELGLLDVNQLKKICKEYGHPVSGRKQLLIERIRSGPTKVTGESDNTLIHTICMNWFMKPLSQNRHLSLGSKNESYILSALKDINILRMLH